MQCKSQNQKINFHEIAIPLQKNINIEDIQDITNEQDKNLIQELQLNFEEEKIKLFEGKE